MGENLIRNNNNNGIFERTKENTRKRSKKKIVYAIVWKARNSNFLILMLNNVAFVFS